MTESIRRKGEVLHDGAANGLRRRWRVEWRQRDRPSPWVTHYYWTRMGAIVGTRLIIAFPISSTQDDVATLYRNTEET